jgi:hypothetical protein
LKARFQKHHTRSISSLIVKVLFKCRIFGRSGKYWFYSMPKCGSPGLASKVRMLSRGLAPHVQVAAEQPRKRATRVAKSSAVRTTELEGAVARLERKLPRKRSLPDALRGRRSPGIDPRDAASPGAAAPLDAVAETARESLDGQLGE